MNKPNKLVMFITIVLFLFGQAGVVYANVSPEQNLFSDKPTIARIPVDDEFTNQSCGFDVRVHITGIIVSISYTDPEGVFHEFQAGPQVRLELTRLDTGNSMTFNISGPGNTTVYADGGFTLVGTGNWSWFFRDPDTLDPGMFLTQGRFVLSIDAEGNRTFTRTGNKIDLCALL